MFSFNSPQKIKESKTQKEYPKIDEILFHFVGVTRNDDKKMKIMLV